MLPALHKEAVALTPGKEVFVCPYAFVPILFNVCTVQILVYRCSCEGANPCGVDSCFSFFYSNLHNRVFRIVSVMYSTLIFDMVNILTK
jgi:hypothetical protein